MAPRLPLLPSLLLGAALLPGVVAAQSTDRPRSTAVPVTRPPAADLAAAELRGHYFRQDFAAGAAAGAQLPPAAGAEARAWHLLNVARDGRAEEALTEAERLRDADPQSPWGWFAIGMAANYADDRGADALAASEEALRRAPRHPDAVWLRAQVLSSQGKNPEAVAFLDSVARHGPLLAHQLVVKANAIFGTAYEKGKFIPERAEAAYAVYAEARRLDSLDLTAHFLAGNRLLNDRRRAEAMPLLERSVTLSPHSLSVRTNYWRALIADPGLTAEAKRARILPQVDSLLAARGAHPAVLSGVANVYDQLELADRKRALEERILAEHPASQEAEWVHVNRYRALRAELADTTAADTSGFPAKRAEYRRLLREFAARPVVRRATLRGDAYRQLFYELRDDSTASPEELYEVVEGMVRHEGINPHVVFGQGAIVLAERTKRFRDAERIARMGLDSGKARIDGQRDSYESVGEHAQALDWMSSHMYDALGWVYFNEGRLADAEKQLLHAAELSPTNRSVSHHLGRLYEAKGELERAEEAYIRGVMTQGMGTNPSEPALKALYARRHGSLDGFEAYHANLAELDRERRRTKVLAERDSTPAPVRAFALQRLDGAPLSSDSLRGKVVVVNHWGVWCGPCVAEMPEFQKLAKRYAGDTSVVVLTINNDTDPNTVREWMRKRGYQFEVLLDDGYARASSVTSYPTTWFIDRAGRVAFTKEGWSEKLEEEFAWRVEALKQP